MEQSDEWSLIIQWANLDTRLNIGSIMTHEEAFNILPFYFKISPVDNRATKYWAEPNIDAKTETKPFSHINGDYTIFSNQYIHSFWSKKMKDTRFVIVGRFPPTNNTDAIHTKIDQIRAQQHKEYPEKRGRTSGPARDYNERGEGEAPQRRKTPKSETQCQSTTLTT